MLNGGDSAALLLGMGAGASEFIGSPANAVSAVGIERADESATRLQIAPAIEPSDADADRFSDSAVLAHRTTNEGDRNSSGVQVYHRDVVAVGRYGHGPGADQINSFGASSLGADGDDEGGDRIARSVREELDAFMAKVSAGAIVPPAITPRAPR